MPRGKNVHAGASGQLLQHGAAISDGVRSLVDMLAKKDFSTISDLVLKMIKDHHFLDYNFHQMPLTICTGCDCILYFIDKADQATKKEDAKRKLLPINYEDEKSSLPSVTTGPLPLPG